MIEELSISNLAGHIPFFPEPHLAIVTASILAGNTRGQLWKVRQAADEPVLLLWDQGNKVFYLAGELVAEAARQALTDLLTTTIRPNALAAGVAYFKARPRSSSLTAALPALFPWCVLRETESLFYEFAQPAPNATAPPPVADLQFVQIDHAFLLTEVLENVHLIRDEIRWMWPSMDQFYAHGFGVAAVIPGRVICWCTAEYVSPTRCGIGITTDEAYQGRGVATATAAHFVQLCQQRGITPCWECGALNAPSMRVAEKGWLY
ncbi:MAG: GNAT family N-acetyltransferase [Caldilineaceae bacterium]